MHLLAIDTTTRRASVALLQDDEVRGEIRLLEDGGHSPTVLPAVEMLLNAAGRRPVDVDAYAVAVGPGSFTGVRVGISTVQGLALGSGRPVVGLSSLEGLAARLQGSAPILGPVMDAYRDQVYAAVYDADLKPRREPASLAPDAWLADLPTGAAVLGDGATRYRDLIRERRPDVIVSDRSLFLAATLGRLARARLARGEGIEAAVLRPLYLRAPDIGRPRPLTAPPAR
jgi:tRNA threonylcarbamoyladenosine biosynthesis protein TsaB